MSGGRGHALAGVRVQKVQRVQRFDGSYAPRVVVGACGASIKAAAEAGALWHSAWCCNFNPIKKPHITVRLFLCFVSFIPAVGFSYYPVPGW